MSETPARSQQKAKKPPKRQKPLWARIAIAIIKWIRVPVLSVLAVFIGLWIGYSKLGHQPPSEILQWSTWKHLYDLVFAN